MRIIIVLFGFCGLIIASSVENEIINTDLECHGTKTYSNVTLTAYYPVWPADNVTPDYLDRFGKKLRTLQDYLDDRVGYVTVSMDKRLNIPYGTPICIPELNYHFKRKLNLQVRDTGDNVLDEGYSRVDICVRTEADSYDQSVNLPNVKIVFLNEM